MAGLFITLEGGEGSGKSTHAKRLAERLIALGRQVVVTREPGGTPGAEQVRGLLVAGETARWSPMAEALLNYAARDSHLQSVIRPALGRDAVVICDRFMDSTRAYQGYAGGCDLAFIDALEKAVVGKTRPDLTLIFDLPAEAGLARAKGRGEKAGEDRYERKGLEFHRRLRQGFLDIQSGEPRRCKLVDAALPSDAVADRAWDIVSRAL
jgi:dTMP kinase